MATRILVIDDESIVIETIEAVFGDMGYEVVGCTDPEQGIRAALDADFDVIVVDLRMPKVDGAQVTERILAQRPGAKIAINTGYPADTLAKRALDAGAVTLLKKPFEIAKIVDLIPRKDSDGG